MRTALGVQVRADDLERQLLHLLGGRLLEHLAIERRVVILPALEPELLAERAGRNLPRHQRRLDDERARAAHAVGERRGAVPSAQLNDPGREHLVHRRDVRLRAVPAPVERVAGRVEVQRDDVLVHVQVQPQVGVLQPHRGPRAGALAELVHDGVLGQLRHVEGIGESRARDHRVNRQRAGLVEVARPVYLADLGVEFLLVGGVEFPDALEDADRGAAAEVGAIEQAQVALEGDEPVERLDFPRAEARAAPRRGRPPARRASWRPCEIPAAFRGPLAFLAAGDAARNDNIKECSEVSTRPAV